MSKYSRLWIFIDTSLERYQNAPRKPFASANARSFVSTMSVCLPACGIRHLLPSSHCSSFERSIFPGAKVDLAAVACFFDPHPPLHGPICQTNAVFPGSLFLAHGAQVEGDLPGVDDIHRDHGGLRITAQSASVPFPTRTSITHRHRQRIKHVDEHLMHHQIPIIPLQELHHPHNRPHKDEHADGVQA